MKRYFFIAAACALACVSCRNNSNSAHHEEPEHEHHGDEIILSPERAEQAGVKVSTVQPGPFTAAIKTSGTVISEESLIAAASSGIISWNGSVPAIGQKVSAGQTIGYISGRNTAEGDAAERAAISYGKALKDYERAKELFKDQIISEREFEAAKAEFGMAESAYKAFSGKNTDRGVSLTAAVSGRICEIFKREGEYAAAGEAIVSIVKNNSMRLQAELPEKYASLRHSVDKADYRLAYDNRVQHSGRLIAVSGDMGSAPYIALTFELPDAVNAIPGAHAEIWLATGMKENVISVPETALTEEQGEFFVYVRVDEDGYVKTHVAVGERNGESVEIVSGLHGGEEVVTEGAYQVKLAAASIIPGHGHDH